MADSLCKNVLYRLTRPRYVVVDVVYGNVHPESDLFRSDVFQEHLVDLFAFFRHPFDGYFYEEPRVFGCHVVVGRYTAVRIQILRLLLHDAASCLFTAYVVEGGVFRHREQQRFDPFFGYYHFSLCPEGDEHILCGLLPLLGRTEKLGKKVIQSHFVMDEYFLVGIVIPRSESLKDLRGYDVVAIQYVNMALCRYRVYCQMCKYGHKHLNEVQTVSFVVA